jgi:hypothetical protein
VHQRNAEDGPIVIKPASSLSRGKFLSADVVKRHEKFSDVTSGNLLTIASGGDAGLIFPFMVVSCHMEKLVTKNRIRNAKEERGLSAPLG